MDYFGSVFAERFGLKNWIEEHVPTCFIYRFDRAHMLTTAGVATSGE
jgi:hypothetical protein